MLCVWYRNREEGKANVLCVVPANVRLRLKQMCPVCGTGQCVWYRRAMFGRLRHQSSRFSVAGEKPAKVVTQTLVLLQLKRCESRRLEKEFQFSILRKLRIDAKLSQGDSGLVSL